MRVLASAPDLHAGEQLAAQIRAAGHTARSTTPAATSAETHRWAPDVVIARASDAHTAYVYLNDPAVRPVVVWIDDPNARDAFPRSRVTVRSGPFDLEEALRLGSAYAG